MVVDNSTLKHISPNDIKPNPDNPRLIFREVELNRLLSSINEVGIKVPISVYEDGKKFVLIDGERRWKCALKLNLKAMPAITQPKPGKLENILMMFNIHNVRVEWDLMPTALKINEVKKLLDKEGKDSSHKNLAGITGVSLHTIRRAFILLAMPEKYKEMLLKEAEKPKNKQKVTADLFLEAYKAVNVIGRYQPKVLFAIEKPAYVDALIDKYLNGIVTNIVKFREVSKIARAELAGEDPEIAIPVLKKLALNPEYTIQQAYDDSVKSAYENRELKSKLENIKLLIDKYKSSSDLPNEILYQIEELYSVLKRLLGR